MPGPGQGTAAHNRAAHLLVRARTQNNRAVTKAGCLSPPGRWARRRARRRGQRAPSKLCTPHQEGKTRKSGAWQLPHVHQESQQTSEPHHMPGCHQVCRGASQPSSPPLCGGREDRAACHRPLGPLRRGSLSVPHKMGPALCHRREDHSPETECVGTMILGLPATRTGRNKCVWVLPPGVWHLLWQPAV